MDYPVKTDQLVEVEVLRMGDQGQGIAPYEGLTLLITGALPGERVRARITETKPRHARAQAIEILRPCAARKTPICPLYAQCGGCVMQHMDEKTRIGALEGEVTSLLSRVGGAAQGSYVFPPTLVSDAPLRYRNKAVYRAGGTVQEPQFGFVARASHTFVAAQGCLLQTEISDSIMHTVRTWMKENSIEPYDFSMGRGCIRHLVVRTNRQGRAMVIVVAAKEVLPARRALLHALMNAHKEMLSLVLNVQTRHTQQILGERTKVLWGTSALPDTLSGLSFALAHDSFFQINPMQTERLYTVVQNFAALTGQERVLDAYCGSGTIGLSLARNALDVLGMEISSTAVQSAQLCATQNGIDNAQFLTGLCETLLPERLAQGYAPDVAIVDPPRAGCDTALIQALVQAAPKRIVYVSCNAATLSRDIKRLCENGYTLAQVQMVDMFPLTGEAETVCLLLQTQKDPVPA